MREKYKKLKIASLSVSLSLSIFFLGFLANLSLAKEASDNKSVIEAKIETVEQQIERDRYNLRLNEAKAYMEKGDRYYAKGKLQEALGEWYAALALTGLLKEEPTSTACLELEKDIEARIESEGYSHDANRQAQIEKKVKEALNREIVKEQAAAKERINASSVQAEKPVIKAQARPADKVSMQDLEAMKKDRQAVEQMISQELSVQGQPVESSVGAKAAQTQERDRKIVEAQIAQDMSSVRIKEKTARTANKTGVDKKIVKEKQLEAQRFSAQDEAASAVEAQIAQQNEEFKRAAEELILGEKAAAEKGAAKVQRDIEIKQKESMAKQIDADKQYKKDTEAAIGAVLLQEAKQGQELKAKTQDLQGAKLKSLMQDEAKRREVTNQLATMEEKEEKSKAGKKTAKKDKKEQAKTSSGPGKQSEQGADKFDIIDKTLQSYDDNFYSEDLPRLKLKNKIFGVGGS